MGFINTGPIPLPTPGAPTSQNPYGLDLITAPNAQGVIDLDPGAREATGRDLLIQSLIRRQTTATGSVIDAPTDCLDLRDWLGEGFTPAQMSVLGSTLQNEIRKDERVQSAYATATYAQATKTLTIVESIVSGYGPFSLTLTVTSNNIAAIVQSLTG